jgi:hypothetical protein
VQGSKPSAWSCHGTNFESVLLLHLKAGTQHVGRLGINAGAQATPPVLLIQAGS